MSLLGVFSGISQKNVVKVAMKKERNIQHNRLTFVSYYNADRDISEFQQQFAVEQIVVCDMIGLQSLLLSEMGLKGPIRELNE
jgi:hypothetical protein